MGFRIKVGEERGIEYHDFCEKILIRLTGIDGEMWGERGDFRWTLFGEYIVRTISEKIVKG